MKILVGLIFLFAAQIACAEKHPAFFHCAGTQPLWSLNLNEKTFSFHVAHATDTLFDLVAPHPAEGMALSFLRVYQTTAATDHEPATILVKDSPEGCTDGKTQDLHGYEALIIFNHKTFVGCCDQTWRHALNKF